MSSFDIGLREQLIRLLEGEVSVRDFRRWFLPLVWSEAEKVSLRSPLARKVELRLAEYQNGHWSEDDLKILLLRELPITSSLSAQLTVTYRGTASIAAMPLVLDLATS
jgi:hypothetical protein